MSKPPTKKQCPVCKAQAGLIETGIDYKYKDHRTLYIFECECGFVFTRHGYYYGDGNGFFKRPAPEHMMFTDYRVDLSTNAMIEGFEIQVCAEFTE